jgi:predicted RecB family nuclease
MVFARKSDAALTSLVKQLDEALAKHADKKLSTFVNLLGEDREALEAEAKQLAEKNKLQNVPVVVPVEFEDGPKNFGINPKAEVTVMLYKGLKVVSNHAFAPGEFNEKGVEAVLADIPKILE